MRKGDIIKIVIEGVASIAISVLADGIAKRLADANKKKDFNNSLVADLTVSELKDIIKGEA